MPARERRPSTAARVGLLVPLAMCVVGAVWFGQGVGWIPGSFMTGDTFYAYAGAALAICGGAILGAYRWRAARR